MRRSKILSFTPLLIFLPSLFPKDLPSVQLTYTRKTSAHLLGTFISESIPRVKFNVTLATLLPLYFLYFIHLASKVLTLYSYKTSYMEHSMTLESDSYLANQEYPRLL
jgi:hypothetical protein